MGIEMTVKRQDMGIEERGGVDEPRNLPALIVSIYRGSVGCAAPGDVYEAKPAMCTNH